MYPRLTAQALETTTKTLLTLSHPWSNSSPIGLEVPVRRACEQLSVKSRSYIGFSKFSSRLLSVDGVERLVYEQTQSAQECRPPRGLRMRLNLALLSI